MTSDNKFGLLRRILRTIGLSQQSADDAVDFIADLLVGEGKEDVAVARSPEFPYHLRDHFLSPAELAFFEVLRAAIANRAILCTKVALGDIFWVKRDDASRHRVYTNKIDRKHVDFLLCDITTMQPIAGIELDDKSHQRQDRQERDAFVDQVFKAAGLPIVHVPVKRTYEEGEIVALLSPFFKVAAKSVTNVAPEPAKPEIKPIKAASTLATSETPSCPKCGHSLVLRTAKSGANAGNRFWGCSNFPTCRMMLPYEAKG